MCYHIFLSMNDFIGAGQTVYEMRRCSGEDGTLSLDNGVHEIYINLEVPLNDESELAGLLRYIRHTTEENERSYFKNIVRSVNDCRQQGKDVSIMEMKYYNSEEFFEAGKEEGLELGREEGREEGRSELIQNMLCSMDAETVSRVTRQPLNYILSLQESLPVLQEENTYDMKNKK